jgi:hypothetical protein
MNYYYYYTTQKPIYLTYPPLSSYFSILIDCNASHTGPFSKKNSYSNQDVKFFFLSYYYYFLVQFLDERITNKIFITSLLPQMKFAYFFLERRAP